MTILRLREKTFRQQGAPLPRSSRLVEWRSQPAYQRSLFQGVEMFQLVSHSLSFMIYCPGFSCLLAVCRAKFTILALQSSEIGRGLSLRLSSPRSTPSVLTGSSASVLWKSFLSPCIWGPLNEDAGEWKLELPTESVPPPSNCWSGSCNRASSMGNQGQNQQLLVLRETACWSFKMPAYASELLGIQIAASLLSAPETGDCNPVFWPAGSNPPACHRNGKCWHYEKYCKSSISFIGSVGGASFTSGSGTQLW